MLLQCVEAEIGEFGAEELDHMLLSVCCPPPPPHPARVARSLGDRTGQVHEVYCGQVGGTRGSLSLSLPASGVADGPAHQVPSFPSIRSPVAAKRRGEQASPRVASLLRVAAGHLMHVEDISLHARRYLLVRGEVRYIVLHTCRHSVERVHIRAARSEHSHIRDSTTRKDPW